MLSLSKHLISSKMRFLDFALNTMQASLGITIEEIYEF
jgi:hypothetical protein